eukprot:jgi/Tetstr1/439770/TSEL_028183.t1
MDEATDFMCLILKMLQIQPEKDIVVEFIKNEDYKYVRLLGAFYLRLVGRPLEVYQYLEPLYNDYRKVRVRAVEGGFQLSHVDELVDLMLTSDYMFDIALPRLPDRRVLEATGQLDPRQSVLDEELTRRRWRRRRATRSARRRSWRRRLQTMAAAAAAGGAAAALTTTTGSVVRSASVRSGDFGSRTGAAAARAPRGRDRGRDDRDYDRDDRDRRDRDRDRGSRRDRDDRSRRSRSGSRERRSSRKERRSSRDRDRGSRRDRSRDRDDRGGGGEDVEIAEANALRAKLGIKPLRQ